jgi:hypothetical protein
MSNELGAKPLMLDRPVELTALTIGFGTIEHTREDIDPCLVLDILRRRGLLRSRVGKDEGNTARSEDATVRRGSVPRLGTIEDIVAVL